MPAQRLSFGMAPPHLRGLLVEDDDAGAKIVAMMTAMMTSYDLSILRVDSVAAARAAIREEAFDLYLVNSWLGDVAALRFVQTHDALARPAGVIMLSNVRQADAESLNLRAESAVYLSKPSLSPERLELAIGKALHDVVPPLN